MNTVSEWKTVLERHAHLHRPHLEFLFQIRFLLLLGILLSYFAPVLVNVGPLGGTKEWCSATGGELLLPRLDESHMYFGMLKDPRFLWLISPMMAVIYLGTAISMWRLFSGRALSLQVEASLYFTIFLLVLTLPVTQPLLCRLLFTDLHNRYHIGNGGSYTPVAVRWGYTVLLCFSGALFVAVWGKRTLRGSESRRKARR